MKLKILLGSFLMLFLIAGTAAAYTLPLDTSSAPYYNNILHDTSGEYLLTGDDYIVDEGDILAGNIIIDRINSVEIGTGTGYSELTAYFEAKVLSVTGDDSVGYSYTFGSSYTTGEMAWFYTDNSGNATLSNPSTLVDGDLWATFGITDSDTTWTAWTFTDDIIELGTYIAQHPTANQNDIGYFNFFLDVIDNYSGLTFKDVGVDNTQLQGQGHFQAKTDDYSPLYAIGDQADMSINVVPEPASMVLFGVGLLGATVVARRRLKR